MKTIRELLIEEHIQEESINDIPNKIEGLPIRVYREKGMDNMLYIDIKYDNGISSKVVTSIGKNRTSSGQELDNNREKATKIGNQIKDMLIQNYDLEDISVDDLGNGKIQVFAVSDDFLNNK